MSLYLKALEIIKTKTTLILSAIVIGGSGMALAIPITTHATNCTQTGFFRDGII